MGPKGTLDGIDLVVLRICGSKWICHLVRDAFLVPRFVRDRHGRRMGSRHALSIGTLAGPPPRHCLRNASERLLDGLYSFRVGFPISLPTCECEPKAGVARDVLGGSHS